MRTRLGAALVLALAVGALTAALAARQSSTPKDIFTCGEDQILTDPIPLSWTSLVLAGDGRLYSPCPSREHGANHREVREAVLLGEGRYSGNGEIRWRAVQAQARNSTRPQVFPIIGGGNPPRPGSIEFLLARVDGLGGLVTEATVQPACSADVQIAGGASNPRRWQPGRLFHMLRELTSGWAVRGETQRMPPTDMVQIRRRIALEGVYAIGVLLSRPGIDPDVMKFAAKELRACFISAGSDVAGPILEALGLARYQTEAEITEVEEFLVRESHATASKTLGAVQGLEALLRRHPKRELGENARIRLRELATYRGRGGESQADDSPARIRRLAILALQSAQSLDFATRQTAVADQDWQVRRLVAGSLNLSDPQMAALGEILAGDQAFQVRYDLLSSISRLAAQTRTCAPIVARFSDPSPAVAMRALDLMPSSCTDLEEGARKLILLADQLANAADEHWQVNSRALMALARIKPNEAKSRAAAAAQSPIWQMRAITATASGMFGDEDTVLKLARDPEPNVRTAVLAALSRLRSAGLVPQAIDALRNGTDYQLIRTAAIVLKGLPNESKDEAATALLQAFQRVTDQESDSSRDVRLAIVDRLEETLNPLRSADLLPFLSDVDHDVNAVVVRLLTRLGGAIPEGQLSKRRYPYQPPARILDALPSQAVIHLESGLVTLKLLKDVAPVTVARFTELVSSGYYNGLTFHRVVPNFIAQGGSPGANDDMGTTRFMRDEVGPQATHIRGAVGIAARGPDAGNGQIFFDLVDLPQFDRDYTIFAYVTQGMDLVDKILEGTKIVSVSVK